MATAMLKPEEPVSYAVQDNSAGSFACADACELSSGESAAAVTAKPVANALNASLRCIPFLPSVLFRWASRSCGRLATYVAATQWQVQRGGRDALPRLTRDGRDKR